MHPRGNGPWKLDCIKATTGDYCRITRGRVAELADALDLGSNGEIRAGSTPVVPTNFFPLRSLAFFGARRFRLLGAFGCLS